MGNARSVSYAPGLPQAPLSPQCRPLVCPGGGNRDLDYFFYEYRAHQIEEFTRQVAIEVHKVRRVEFSAAVFKNPVQSGRFIGQDWRRFSP